MVRAGCAHEMADGRQCAAPPLRGGELCFWHEPKVSEDLADAQRLGGVRRKREQTVAAAYDVAGLDSVGAIRRVILIAVLDTLGLENSLRRTQALQDVSAGLAMASEPRDVLAVIFETGELEERIAALEAAVAHQTPVDGADPLGLG